MSRWDGFSDDELEAILKGVRDFYPRGEVDALLDDIIKEQNRRAQLDKGAS